MNFGLARELPGYEPAGFPAGIESEKMCCSNKKGVTMNERQWELYRLSVVETWSESPYKRAVSAAIEHKLKILGQHTSAGVNPSATPGFPRYSL
jgi:hypothetical protein